MELETSADLENSQNIAQLEKNSSEMAEAGLSRQNGLVEDKSQTIEEMGADKKDDLAVPNWPKYQDPVGQRAEIDKELKSVRMQTDEFKKTNEDAESQMKKIGQTGKNDFDQKQKEIELQHKATVSKIKSEIWGDRLAFLQKMVKLAEEGKQDDVASPNDKPTIKA